ncbi:MAG: MerC domain-containing protein [Pseudomonadota bacterium]
MQILLDRFAILLSGLCAIHCIALPIMAAILPILSTTYHHGNQLHEFWFHQFILYFIVPVSIIALVSGYRSHKKLLPIVIASIGLLILSVTALFIDQLLMRHVISHDGEMLMTLTGGIIHATGHILNLQATRKSHQPCKV